MAEGHEAVIRRKLKPRDVSPEVGDAARALRLALARAAQDEMALVLDVTTLDEARRSLAELLDLPPERALIAMLEGPGERLGTIALSPEVLASMIETLTMGRVAGGAPVARRATRTDAAMVSGYIDRLLAQFAQELDGGPDAGFADGVRYASFLEDPRPLGLILEEVTYRVFTAEVSLAGGLRRGSVVIALPATAMRARAARQAPKPDAAQTAAFRDDMTAQVMAAEATLDAVLARLAVPLATVLALKPGDVLPLTGAALDQIGLEAADGQGLAEGRLGQNRGMRAVRLTRIGAVGAAAAMPPPGPRLAATG